MIMEENLRKHILSQYTNNSRMKQIFNPTVNTAAGEISDPDEFHLCDSTTYETNTIEISDPDEFCLSEKIINNDNMLMTQTRHIYTIETSDEDEFLLM
jgi:hypothetical protein